MARLGFMRTLLTMAVVLTISSPAAAQDVIDLEGPVWHLVRYDSSGASLPVPLEVEATLRLQDGEASGSYGCNSFTGGYASEGEMLTFDDPLAVTGIACPGAAAAVEQGHMSNLANTTSWSIDQDQLRLADADGSLVLTYEIATNSLTPSDLAVLAARFDAQQARIDALEERLGNVRIGALRDRIRDTEEAIAGLQGRLQAQDRGRSSSSPTRFNSAEGILLEAIPAAIRRTCTPRRSENPRGTIAAVQCKPNTAVVRDMAYYLMTGSTATRVFEQRMAQNGVRSRSAQCRDGVASTTADTPGPGFLGCYVNDDGRANLRLVVPASGCNQLPVGARTIRIPAIYIAVLGNDDDIRKLARWREERPGRPILAQEIKRPNAPFSPRCPT